MTSLVICYVTCVVPFGMMFAVLAPELVGAPDGTLPAIGVACGVLWPLTLVALAIFGAWRSGRALARSFAALWRHIRGPSVPRAVARERTRT